MAGNQIIYDDVVCVWCARGDHEFCEDTEEVSRVVVDQAGPWHTDEPVEFSLIFRRHECVCPHDHKLPMRNRSGDRVA